MLTAAVLLGVGARAVDADSLDPRHIVALTNESRRHAGLRPVAVDEKLTAAARAKLFDMLKQDYFDHRTPDGRQPWAFMQAAGYRFQMAAENLAKGYDNEPELQRAWMKSRGHRANILNPQFTEIGVADANGIVVVMFGRPAPTAR
ncbi:MAG: CAP domain-containing protein [Vicinamibacteraceae bacterium]